MKKTLALLLVVFTLIAQLSMVTVSADGATVTVETVEAAAGETVDVKVDLGNCAGFANLMLEFEYDSALTLVGATNGITGLTPTTSKNLTDEPYVMLWESNTNTVYSGTIVTFQFKVADNAVAGKYDIKVAAGKGPTGDFEDGYDCNYDENFDDINLSYVNGGITIPAVVVPSKPDIPEFVAPSGAYVKVEDYAEFANPGDTIDLKVDLGNCAGFANLMLEFEYDSALTLVGATNGITGLTPTTSKNLTDEPYVMLWESNTNTVYSGTIVTFQFKVADNAVAGKYDIKVAAGKGPTGDFEDGYDCNYDENFDDINLSYFNGSIHVAGGDDPAPTEYALDAVVAGNGVEITAEGPAMDGKIIAALYNGKKLAQVKIFDAAADLSATFTNTGDKIKVMWWDGMLTAKPLCDSVELPLN